MEEKSSHSMPPSKVVHCRAVAEACKETDLVDAMKIFGNIKALKLMPKISQALVEFETLESAIGCVTYGTGEQIIIHGRQMYVNYSKSTEINRKFTSSQDQSPTKILLLTVLNVIHPVNVETIRKICQQQNIEVQRIVIFHKNGLQAFVEFRSVDDASRILQSLNGCDIYPGCCTLKVEFSKSKPLNVRKNNEESYNIDLVESLMGSDTRYNDWDAKPILPSAANGYSTQYTNNTQYSANPMSYDSDYSQTGPPGYNQTGPPGYNQTGPPGYNQTGPPGYTQTGPSQSGGSGGGEGCVAMVYGVNNNSMNCDHLFNLFCLYGNVVKVKVLTSKEGIAMVQYAEKMSTEMAMQYFNYLNLFGQPLQVTFSKHPFIAASMDSTPLFDGTPSVVSYADSRNNRFNPVPGGKNDLYSRIHPPSKVLHYFNAPPDTTEERLKELFESFSAEVPVKQAMISKPNGKSSSGLLEFSSVSAAAEALVLVNHVTLHKDESDPDSMRKPGAPFTFKLAFSQSTTINK